MAERDQEQLAREFAEELRKLRVEDVLVQSLVTISQVGYRRLGMTPETAEDRDLDQARLAIESMDALTPVLERFVDDQLIKDFRASVSSLKLAYAQAASDESAGAESRDAPAEDARAEDAPAEDSPAEDSPAEDSLAGDPMTNEAGDGDES